MNYIFLLLIGLIAGWLAGILMRGKGFGILINMIIGVIGAFLGGTLFELFGIHLTGYFGPMLSAFVGAIILVWVIGLFKKPK